MVKSPIKICIRVAAIVAFAMLIGSMLYLLAIWDTIPDNIGVHFSSEGQFDVYDSKLYSFYPYEKLKPSGSMTITYDVLTKKESPVLCESYRFTTIGAFLYIELFKGLQQHYLPKKCGYCGKYFLLDGGLFSDYCTRPVKNMEGKVCRDVGHRKKYADKVKNDPIWTVYVRGYKQHYARLLKKKMTQAEFQKWADYALELRQKAFDEELEFEEYQRLMKE